MVKSNNFLNNGTYGNKMVVLQTGRALIDIVNIEKFEIYENLKDIAQFNLELFYQL